MKISVEISITEKRSFDTHEIAAGRLAVEHVSEEFDARAIRRSLEDLLEDVTERVTGQLRERQKAADRERQAVEDGDRIAL